MTYINQNIDTGIISSEFGAYNFFVVYIMLVIVYIVQLRLYRGDIYFLGVR